MAKKEKTYKTDWEHPNGELVIKKDKDSNRYFAYVKQEDGKLFRFIPADSQGYDGGDTINDVRDWLDTCFSEQEPDEPETLKTESESTNGDVSVQSESIDEAVSDPPENPVEPEPEQETVSDEPETDEQDINELQTKASAYDEIVKQNRIVTSKRQTMEDTHLDYKAAKSEYEKACKNQEEIITQFSNELPLFPETNVDDTEQKNESDESSVCRKCGNTPSTDRYFVASDLCGICADKLGKDDESENDKMSKQAKEVLDLCRDCGGIGHNNGVACDKCDGTGKAQDSTDEPTEPREQVETTANPIDDTMF